MRLLRRLNIPYIARRIKRSLSKEIRANRKVEKALSGDFVFNKKLSLLSGLQNDNDTTGELIDIIEKQLNSHKNTGKHVGKYVKINRKFREQAQLYHELIHNKTEVVKAGLAEINRQAKELNDQDAMAVYSELIKTTLEQAEVADQQFDAVDVESRESDNMIKKNADLMLNLKKQLSYVASLQGTDHPSTVKNNGRLVVDILKDLFKEEEVIIAVVIQSERRVKRIEASLLDFYARANILDARIRKMISKAISGTVVVSGLALGAFLVDDYIERYLVAKPGATSVEVTEVVKKYIGSEQFQKLVYGQRERIASEIVKGIDVSDPSREQLIKLRDEAIAKLATEIADRYIEGVAGLGDKLRGIKVGEIRRSRTQIIRAITTHIQRHNGEVILITIRDLAAKSKKPSQGKSIWDMLKQSDLTKSKGANETEQEVIADLRDRLEVEISKIVPFAIQATARILDEMAQEAIKTSSPSEIKSMLLYTYDFLKKNFWWLLLAMWGFGRLRSAILTPREMRSVLKNYKDGLLESTKHMR